MGYAAGAAWAMGTAFAAYLLVYLSRPAVRTAFDTAFAGARQDPLTARR
jgi:hypothetical protein